MSNLSELFPGCEALMEEVEINNNVSVPSEQIAGEVAAETEAADVAETGAEVSAEGEATEQASEMFAHQFGELCAMQSHIEKYGVDRTFLSLCNRGNILGRAFGIQMPACESFDTVGSPYSPVSVACMEAMSDGLWKRFKDWVAKIYHKIRNFITKVMDWFREAFGNWELRLGKLRKWEKDNSGNANLKIEKEKEFLVYDTQTTIDGSIKTYKAAIQKLIDDTKTGSGKDGYAIIQKAINAVQVNLYSSTNASGRNDGLTNAYASTSDPNIGRTAALTEDEEKKLKDYAEEQKKAVKEAKKLGDKWDKKSPSAAIDSSAILKDVSDALTETEDLIKKVREYDRAAQTQDMSFSQAFERMNQKVQREDGNSLGSKARTEISRTINLIVKFDTDRKLSRVAYAKAISFCLKSVSSYISCASGTIGSQD